MKAAIETSECEETVRTVRVDATIVGHVLDEKLIAIAFGRGPFRTPYYEIDLEQAEQMLADLQRHIAEARK